MSPFSPPAMDLTPLILWSVTENQAPIGAECDSCFSQSSSLRKSNLEVLTGPSIVSQTMCCSLIEGTSKLHFLEMFQMCSTLSTLYSTKHLLFHVLLGRKVMTNLDSIFKSRDITLPTKIHLVKAMVFSSSHEWMWELDSEESWALKNWCFWTVVLEKTLESPLGCREIQPVHPKGDQSRVFIGRTDVEAETPILWPPHAKNWLIGKDPNAGKDWGQE